MSLAPSMASDLRSSGEFGRKKGLVFFSNPIVDGIVERPSARAASTSFMRATRSALLGSSVSAKRPLLWVYSWPQKMRVASGSVISFDRLDHIIDGVRSEERRVGKEG